MASKYGFFLDLCEIKTLTAAILQQLNDSGTFRNGQGQSVALAPDAVKQELDQFYFIMRCYQKNKLWCQRPFTRKAGVTYEELHRLFPTCRTLVLFVLSNMSRHTIVCHPVGLHHDVFTKGSTVGLENKILFSFKNQLSGALPPGRAGDDLRHFSFGIFIYNALVPDAVGHGSDDLSGSQCDEALVADIRQEERTKQAEARAARALSRQTMRERCNI